MLLAIDLGNTDVVLGLFDDGEPLLHRWRLQASTARTEDEYGLQIAQLLERAGYAPSAIEAVALASVVPELTPVLARVCERNFACKPLIVGPGVKTGISIRYNPTKDVGADRIVNAVAAFARYRSACIVVDFGTAITFDCITSGGAYVGGAIAPGVQVSMSGLFARAAKLPKVDLVRPPRVVGRTTAESIQSGVFYGYVSLVDGVVTRMKAEMEDDEVRVIATGALAEQLAADAQTIDVVHLDLTLEGLRHIYALGTSPLG